MSDNTVTQDISAPKFRSRNLNDPNKVFEHNAWDDVDMDEEYIEKAKEIIETQSQNSVKEEDKKKYEEKAAEYWNIFYKQSENRFFKDRNWLKSEFPELFSNLITGNQKITVLEIGCGTGATAYPLLEENQNPNLMVIASDFSKTAVDLVLSNPKFDPKRQKAFVWDMTSLEIPDQIEPNSIDIITLIFAFSAINPSKWSQVMKNLNTMLKEGGIILFRDYGRYDMAQLRFKKQRYIEENFYARGDGTQVYFFDQDEINQIFKEYFIVIKNEVDRRLLVNRHRQLKMHRVWIQAKFQKPFKANENEVIIELF